jgi:hypothetical protein
VNAGGEAAGPDPPGPVHRDRCRPNPAIAWERPDMNPDTETDAHDRDRAHAQPVVVRPAPAPGGAPAAPLSIDCDTCVMHHTDACDDCVVTFICSREPDEAVVIDVDEARALRLLGDVGLVPHLRHRRRTG